MSNLNLSNVSGKVVLAATFSRGTYDSKTPFVPPAGFEPLRVVLENPQSPDFAASAYVNPKTGELVVAYRGSDSTTDLTTALKGAANGTWSGQFTDAAAFMKQAQGNAAEVVSEYSKQENITDLPKITTLATGHSLGGMLAQVTAKMYGVEAQVQDAPGAARLINTPQFKQAALDNGQPESGHDITGKVQNVTTSKIAKLGEQFEETQIVPIPALGQMGGLDTLATIGAFVANPVAGLATGAALQTTAAHSSEKIEDALHMLAGVKGQIADAGELTLQPMYLDRNGKPTSFAPTTEVDSSHIPTQIHALVDKSGKAIAFFSREVVDGEMQPVAVVVESGNRIHLTHGHDGSSPQVIETTASGERRVVSNSELLASLQDARGTPEINTNSVDAVNGMDFESDQTHKAQENSSHSQTYDTSDQKTTDSTDPSDATQQVVDAFSNPQIPTDKGEQVADSGAGLPDKATNTNSFSNYLDAQGNTLSSAQQTALATQIGKLGLGGEGELSFYSLPGGGALIANADGDIVGEIVHSPSGRLNLRATGIDTDGNTVEVNQHITEQGTVQTQDQYNAQTQQQANASVNLFNSLMATQQWAQLDDMGKLAVLVNVYSAVDTLGGELPGDLGGLASVLSLMQGLESGNDMLVLRSSLQLGQMGLDAYSDYMADLAMQMADDLMASATVDAASSAAMDAAAEAALESAAASNAAGQAVPYVSYVMALQNFEDHPEQAIGTMAGTYVGTAIGAFFGPVGAAIGGAIGGMIGGMVGGMFGGDPPPPPLGRVHFGWDADGAVIPVVDINQSEGASVAISVANNLLDGLNQIVSQRNHAIDLALSAQGVDPSMFASFHVRVNASALPSVHWDQQNGACIGDPSSSLWSPATNFFSLVENDSYIQPEWAVNIEKFQSTSQSTDVIIDEATNTDSVKTPELKGSAQITVDATGEPTILSPSNGLGGQIAKMYAQEVLHQAQLQVDLLNLRIDHKLNSDGIPEAQWSQYHVAVNPAKLPEVEFDGEYAYFINHQSDGVAQFEVIQLNGFAEQLQAKLTQAGCIQASWEYETIREHWINAQSVIHEHQLQGDNTSALEADALKQLRISEVYGGATESSDFKTQSYGALLVHAQGEIASTIELLRDVDGDGYLEKTQSFAAKDFSGKSQGLLVLDFNSNGLIETRDILNLGGNKGQYGNPTDEARIATQNANLQRNNVEWLDANGDGQITSKDPTFAAIKLWIDVNQDGQMDTGEGKSLATQNIISINFRTGEIIYDDGHRDALTVTTLTADTEGVKFTQISALNPDGTLHTLDAGTVLEHEGYQGKVQITDEGGTRWVNVREQTYEQQAKRTGDWEGTADQETHRHGGGNVAGAPTETTATGATNFGAVKTTANVITQSTVDEGDARVISDVPTQHPTSQVNVQTSVSSGDSRIQSSASIPIINVNNAVRPADPRIVFVPTSQSTVQNDIQTVTRSMIENSQSMLFGGGIASLGVLAAVGTGATVSAASAAEATQRPVLASDVHSSDLHSAPPVATNTVSNSTFTSTPISTSAYSNAPPVTFKQVDLGELSVPQVVQTAPASFSSTGAAQTPNATNTDTSNTIFVQATVVVTPPVQAAPNKVSSVVTADTSVTANSSQTPANNALAPSLGHPVVQAETLNGTEDVVLRLTPSILLANDSTPNASAKPDAPALTITAVSAPQHGQVSLVKGEVLFAPDTNFHGTASFTYTVTDQYGLSTTGTAQLMIAAVNDVPVTQDESYSSEEDIGLIFTQAQLLQNDSDVDIATDGQTLSISRVGQAEHGTVWLDAQGNLRFEPDANYHGPAKFTYWVSDGAGAETPATMRLTIATVNDMPVAQGESTDTAEDTTLSIDAATLLANDKDVDIATDRQVLSISAVSNAANCTVSLVTQPDGTQRITFVPDANFHGTATFDYAVSDGNGGTAIATAVVNLSAVNDAPVTTGETATGDEDNTLVFSSQELLANDTDVDVATDGQVLIISRVSGATHGTVTLDAQGHVHFKPDENYHGPAQFTYWVSDGLAANGAGAEVPATVSLTILAVNDLPVVTGETINTNEDTTLLFDPATLLANDSDADVATDSQTLRITTVNNATNGTVSFETQPDGSQRIAFKPDENYFGIASYQYTVSDGQGGSTIGTVVVNLAQTNDAPVGFNDTLQNTAEDTALRISFASLLNNDTDADSQNAQWGGINDALRVSRVGNATHGSVTIVNGEVVFSPDANYHGPASFAYEVRDSSGAVAQALATFTVTAVNDAPVTQGETISEMEDTTLIISQAALLQNDSDADTATDSQTLTITAVSNALNGTVTLNANGTITFEPKTNFFGNASFDYTVSDGQGGSTIATATIALANVNDAPVATGETVQSREDQELTITASSLLQNESDIDNALTDLDISRVRSGTGGTVSLNASGNVVFTPTANYNGTATFTYWVKDPGGLESNPVTTTVVLAAVNDAPNAQGEIVAGASEDAPFNINKATLLANDHDIDDPDSALSLSWVGNAAGGEVRLDANGNVVFTPSANFNGSATFQYKVRDAAGLESAIVQAVIPVATANDAPVAVDDQFTTYKNSTMTIGFNQLTSNDKDIDGDVLTVSAVRDKANGHATIVNGQVQFVANTGFTGAASFDYLADDGQGGQTWATAFVDVRPPPNQYATMTLKNFAIADGRYGYDINASTIFTNGSQTFSLHDDGSIAGISVKFLGASFVSPYPIWENTSDASKLAINWDSTNGVFSWNASALTWTTGNVRQPLWDGTLAQMIIKWELTDSQGLSNICTYKFNPYYDIGPIPDDESNSSLTALLNGTSRYASASTPHIYGTKQYSFVTNEHSGLFVPPVILDLNGDGVHFTSLQNSNVTMDVNFDGIQDKMAWASNDDGVLVWDKDHNGRISDASEFGFQTLRAGAQTDLEGLQALDTNGNGLLDAADNAFADFAVWQDANGNGVTDAGEFKTLNELGIASIKLKSDGQMRDAGTLLAQSGSGETDATVMGNAAFTRTDGTTGVVADTMLAYEAGHATQTSAKVVDTATADAQTAEINRQALLFNQMCNTAAAVDSTPMGFVPIHPDVQLHDLLVDTHSNPHQLTQSA